METLTASCVRNLHVQVKSLNKQKPHTHTKQTHNNTKNKTRKEEEDKRRKQQPLFIQRTHFIQFYLKYIEEQALCSDL